MENRESITASPMERIGRNGSSVHKHMEQNHPTRQPQPVQDPAPVIVLYDVDAGTITGDAGEVVEAATFQT